MKKCWLSVNFIGIFLITASTSNTRQVQQLKKQLSTNDADRRWKDESRANGMDRRDNRDKFESLLKREIGAENLAEEQDDMNWRKEDWMKQENAMQRRYDPLTARQEEFDSWLRKRGSAPVELDPEAARVASKQAELQELLQQLYEAQAAVKMETGEVSRTQQVAQEAQSALEEATNKVRMLSADLQSAQESAAAAAMRAHTAQLQLSAHDQLMFTARQRVDALSAQMVSIQAELAAAQQAFTLNNSSHLLEAQGRGLEPSLFQDKLINRSMCPLRGILPADNIPCQAGISPHLASSNLIDEKHGDGLTISSLPSMGRQSYNYLYQ